MHEAATPATGKSKRVCGTGAMHRRARTRRRGTGQTGTWPVSPRMRARATRKSLWMGRLASQHNLLCARVLCSAPNAAKPESAERNPAPPLTCPPMRQPKRSGPRSSPIGLPKLKWRRKYLISQLAAHKHMPRQHTTSEYWPGLPFNTKARPNINAKCLQHQAPCEAEVQAYVGGCCRC